MDTKDFLLGQQFGSFDPHKNMFHNLQGQRGPMCLTCSGLGRVLPLVVGVTTKYSTTCHDCRGTGVDPIAAFQSTIQKVEAKLAQQEKKLRDQAALIRKLKQLPDVKNSRQFWAECISWATADGTAVANTTTETILMPNVTIPGSYMADGRLLSMRVAGRLSTTGTPTMVWAVRWGGVSGTILANTEAITMGSGVSNVNWVLDIDLQVRSNGATGTIFAMGELKVHTSSTAVSQNVFGVSGFDASAAVTVDLTADTPLAITGDWSAQSSSNTITGHMYRLISWN